MKLFTKEIESKLQAQYELASELEKQVVVCKIFNPYGAGTWYLINQDPKDPDYLYGICKIDEVEIGSVLKSDIENIRLTNAKLPLERDRYFKQINAKVAFDRLLAGNHL